MPLAHDGARPPTTGSRAGSLLALALALALGAAADKLVGVIGAPSVLALAAYLGAGTALLRWPRWRAPLRLGAVLALTLAILLAWRALADPTPLTLWRELHAGDALLEANRRDDAMLRYRRAEQRAPHNPHVLIRLGAGYYRLGDYARAARAYERALHEARPPLAPRHRWRIWIDLGQTYWKLGRASDALRAYQEAIRLGIPASERPLMDYRLAGAYFDLRDFDRSIEHYQRVAAAGGEYAAASLYNIACAYAQKYASAPQDRRPAYLRAALDSLRLAWERATDPADRETFLDALVGGPDDLDHELDPIRPTPEMEAFLATLRRLRPPARSSPPASSRRRVAG